MVKKIAIRLYHLADASLKQLGDLIKLFVIRDLAAFTNRGVTQITIDALEVLITDFDDVPTDIELLGPVMEATEIKNALASDLKIAIRPIRNMVEVKYGNTTKFHAFGFTSMDKLTDDDLRRLVKRVVIQGTALLSELASEGLTEAMLTALSDLNNSFDDAIDNQKLLIAARDTTTEERINKGNALYTEIARLCSISQSIYVDTDPAKYNDYVIYGSSSTPPSLRGLVRDSVTQEPITDAIIDIPAMGLTKTSNSEGKFEVQTMEAGSYDMNVSHPGYQPNTVTAIIIEGETTHVTIDLVPE